MRRSRLPLSLSGVPSLSRRVPHDNPPDQEKYAAGQEQVYPTRRVRGDCRAPPYDENDERKRDIAIHAELWVGVKKAIAEDVADTVR